jgi:hypothetical protein
MNKKIKIESTREIDKGKKNIVQTTIYNINDLFLFLLLFISPIQLFFLFTSLLLIIRTSKMNNYILSDFKFEFVFE